MQVLEAAEHAFGGVARPVGRRVERVRVLAGRSYLRCFLGRIADRPVDRVAELLPWNLRDQLVSSTN